jgi:PIN domain nuclease of toxin-antitoxin system
MLSGSSDDINTKVKDILYDYSNILLTSSIAANELILLHKIGKIELLGCKSSNEVFDKLMATGIEIVFFNKHHLSKYITLDLVDGHKDMNDHAIIAQSISDKIPLISSDTKFHQYTNQGLYFLFNKR